MNASLTRIGPAPHQVDLRWGDAVPPIRVLAYPGEAGLWVDAVDWVAWFGGRLEPMRQGGYLVTRPLGRQVLRTELSLPARALPTGPATLVPLQDLLEAFPEVGIETRSGILYLATGNQAP
jgi:hypothetical protein